MRSRESGTTISIEVLALSSGPQLEFSVGVQKGPFLQPRNGRFRERREIS